MLEVPILAATAVRILVPYVKKGAEGLANAIGERADRGAADFAVGVAAALWERVRTALTVSGQAGAVTEFEQNPEDAQDYLERLLARRLNADKSLAKALDELVSSHAPGDGRGVVQIMNSSGVLVIQGTMTGGIAAGSIGAIGPVRPDLVPERPTDPPPQSSDE